MSQQEQTSHINSNESECVTFVSVRADSNGDAIRQAISTLIQSEGYTSFDVVHDDGDGIYVVRAAHNVPSHM